MAKRPVDRLNHPPSWGDRELAGLILAELGLNIAANAANAGAGLRSDAEEGLARLLHQRRVVREAELRGVLARLGPTVEAYKYQLIKLGAAHKRTKDRLAVKVRDCDRLKAALRDRGLTRQEILDIVRGGTSP